MPHSSCCLFVVVEAGAAVHAQTGAGGGGGTALLDRGGRKRESSPVRSRSQGRGAATEEARGEQLEKHCLLNSALTSVGGQSGDEMVGRGFLKEDVAAWRLR